MDKIDAIQYLTLGQHGDNVATTIQIDMSDWLLQWPDASIFVVAVRHDETNPYVVSTTMEGNVLCWSVTDFDTAIEGLGYAEVRAVGVEDGLVKKSKVIKTVVNRSITDEDADYDDRNIEYIKQLLSAAAMIYQTKLRIVSNDDGYVTFNGGAAEENGYLLDTTLRQVGRAADSGAVGSALDLKADKSELEKAETDLLACWPVGSYYMTEDPALPDTIFGGKWERVRGVFMFAADGMHNAGSTGGVERVALTDKQVPQPTENIAATSLDGD